jgi:nanoRNase/pAp phosphatase (c-di-AMP/oligoRNAs hydrolase)
MSIDDLGRLIAEPAIEFRPELRWWLAEGLHTDETLRYEIDTAHDRVHRLVDRLRRMQHQSNGTHLSLHRRGSLRGADRLVGRQRVDRRCVSHGRRSPRA